MSKIYALGYYDGATEGFATDICGYDMAYFKILAWDGEQDQRLFAVTSIQKEKLDRFVENLVPELQTKTRVQLVDEGLRSDSKKNIELLVSSCKQDICLIGNLCLSNDGLVSTQSRFPIGENLQKALKQALEAEQPESLDVWLDYLK